MTLNLNGSAYKLDTLITGVNAATVQLDLLNDHVHSKGKVIPSQAAALVVTGTSTAWELGAKVLIGTSVIASSFDLHWVNIETVSAADVFECVISEGATTGSTEISRFRFQCDSTLLKTNVPIITPILTANKKTHVQICNKTTIAKTLGMSFGYHMY